MKNIGKFKQTHKIISYIKFTKNYKRELLNTDLRLTKFYIFFVNFN